MIESEPNFSLDLRGQVALVTGASSGLGWRFAEILAARGAAVALAARRTDRLDALAQQIEGRGGRAIPVALDVSGRGSIVAAIDHIEAVLGGVSILINNAGVPDADHATRLSPEKVDQVLDVNLRGAFILATEVARRLIAAGRPGRFVNIASMAAFDYRGNGAALYSMTKAGLVRMTETLAVEWARFHINVNAIAPGVFASEMTDGMLGRMSDEMVRQFPRRRICQPEQLDSTLLFLVSPSSECVTGTIIKVDDGQHGR